MRAVKLPRFRIAAHAAGDSALGDHQVAVHASVIPPGEVPSEVHLIPAGEIATRDGRGPYALRDAQAVIDLSRAYHDGNPIPIDYDHQTEYTAKNGAGAPASGWITSLHARADGIWGTVEWTPPARERIRNKEYRYLSPVFAYRKDGTIIALVRAGLLNNPNLALTAINSTLHHEEDMSQTEFKAFLQRVAAVLGLTGAADEDAVLTAVNSTVTSERTNREAVAALRGKLQLTDAAGADEILVAAQASAVVDPKRYVPVETYTAMSDQLAAMKCEKSEQAADAAIAAGKVVPSNRQWAIDYHSRDPQGFADFIGKQVAVLQPGEEKRRPDFKQASTTLSDTERAICAASGISEDSFLKTRNAHKES